MGPAGGDAKAVGLVAEMESGDWGRERLTEADRTGDDTFFFHAETTRETRKIDTAAVFGRIMGLICDTGGERPTQELFISLYLFFIR